LQWTSFYDRNSGLRANVREQEKAGVFGDADFIGTFKCMLLMIGVKKIMVHNNKKEEKK